MHFCGHLYHDTVVNTLMLGQIALNAVPHIAAVVRNSVELHRASKAAAKACGGKPCR